MKLVIEIDENVRIAISRMGLLRIPNKMQEKVDKAIQHGTPIPTGKLDGYTEWILCSEKLPSDPRQVLVTVLWHEPHDNFEVTLGEYWDEPEGWGDWKDGEVIAWMPLPTPYRDDYIDDI